MLKQKQRKKGDRLKKVFIIYMSKICIIGAGSWGLALSLILNKNGHSVTIWSALQNEIDELKTTRKNKKCLPNIEIPKKIIIEEDLSKTIEEKEVIVLAVASPYIRQTANKLSQFVKKGQIIVNVAKGIEESSLKTLSEVIKEEIPQAEIAVLSGPSHAEEVSRFIPTTCVIGAEDKQTAKRLQEIFMNDVFRVYINPDIIGIELGASLKNVIALAAGMLDGLNYGDNTKAALITRGIAEISRLGIAMGGQPETFFGLTGIGDLIVTCASIHSRNRKAGILIGQGKTMQESMDEVKMVVEGVYSAKAALKLSKKYNIEMPIVEQVNEVLFNNKNPKLAVNEVMNRDKKTEINWKY